MLHGFLPSPVSGLRHAALMVCWLIAWLALAPLPAGATQSATVTWSPSPDTNVVAYKIYYGGTSGNYTNVISVGNVTNVTVSGLADRATYFFAATAVSSSGAQSTFTPETSYVVPTAAATLASAVTADTGFSFTVSGVPGYHYVIQASTNMVTWESLETNVAPFSFVDSNAGQFNRRFYRSLYLP